MSFQTGFEKVAILGFRTLTTKKPDPITAATAAIVRNPEKELGPFKTWDKLDKMEYLMALEKTHNLMALEKARFSIPDDKFLQANSLEQFHKLIHLKYS